MKIVRKIISYIFSILVVTLMFATIILSMVNAVIFSKSNIKNKMQKVDYYTEISNIIKDSANNYIMQSGFDESIMDNVIPKEKINNDIDKVINAIYASTLDEEIAALENELKSKKKLREMQKHIENNN